LPTVAPSYVYTFFALVTVSTILISSFSVYATSLRNIPEEAQLNRVLTHVAAEGCKLVTLTMRTNSTSEIALSLPIVIGSKQYWIRLRNESSSVWFEGALGSIHKGSPRSRVCLPNKVSAEGDYSSYDGRALLQCYKNGSIINLRLFSLGEDR